MSKKQKKETKVEKSGAEEIKVISGEARNESLSEQMKSEGRPESGKKPETGRNPEPGEEPETGRNPKPGKKPEMGRNPEPGKKPEMGRNPEPGESPEKTGEAREAVEKEAVALESEETGKKKKKSGGKAKWVVIGVVLVLLNLLGAGYAYMAIYYTTHFFPGSSINGIDCSNMEAAEAAALVDAQIDTYCLQVFGRDHATGASPVLIGEIIPGDISLSYIDSMGSVENLLAEQNEWSWIQAYTGGTVYGYSLVQGVQFDEDKLNNTVKSWEACLDKNMQKPQDAYIGDYNDEIGGYEVIPETIGTALKMDVALECISSAIYAKQTDLDLEQQDCYIEPSVTQTDAGLTALVDTVNTWLGAEITYDWNGNEVVLGLEDLKNWIAMEQDGPVLDEEAVRSFVKEQAKKYNTYGKKKKFVTALGIELTLDSPNYGWKADTDAETEELIQLIYQGQVTQREPVYSVTAMEKGSKDIGGDYIEADLTHQHLYVYQDGQVVLETDFVSGRTNIVPSRATPAGIFGLTYKTRNATLRGADYESFVNYWMPFYGNYGMHDATWRRDFGGTIFQDHGSHGCINLPLASAEVIYGYVSTGFPVICYYYEVDPLAPPAETQMPSEEELLQQEEPGIGQNAGEPGADAAAAPGAE
ncbi:MAG: L,D-transpeptidase family protein [Firmicutes bacterium]|nr:L,D-transpeptidase family protein [Bacillota bacterium]